MTSRPRLVLLALAAAIPAVLFAAGVPHTFANGSVADAADVNANFTNLSDRLTRFEQTGAPGVFLKSPDGTKCLKLSVGNDYSHRKVAVNCTTGAEIGLVSVGGAFEIAGGTYLPSCKAYRAYPTYANEGSGVYSLDPDGNGLDPVRAYCDMASDGGTGWTLVLTRSTTLAQESLTTEGSWGSDVTNPEANANNMLKVDWALLGFTEAKYQLNDNTTTYWFANLSAVDRSYAKTAIFVNKTAQSQRPNCTSAFGGGTTYNNCGTGNSGQFGWVGDPGSSWCWILHSGGNAGAGNCSNAAGRRGRIWLR